MTVDTLNLNSLRFYTGDGKQIIMQKQYSCQWEIVPADCIYSAFMKNPSGHLEIEQPVDLTGVTSTVLDGYVITNKITLSKNTTYTVTLYGFDAHIALYKGNVLKDDKTYANISDGATTYVFSSTQHTDCDSFIIKTYDNDSWSATSKSNLVSIAVDEPGEICPYVTFNRKSSVSHEIFSYNNTKEIDNFSYLGDGKKSLYNTLDDTNTINLNNIYDIIFFSYRYTQSDSPSSDDDYQYESNKIVFTINTGSEIATAEYRLIDFFRTSTSRATTTNLIKYKSWNTTSHWLDKDTSTEEIYGVKSELFNQVKLTETDFDYTNETEATKSQSSAYYVMNYNVDENQFPYFKLVGTVYQDKVSAGFINPTTVIVVKDNGNISPRYTYPSIVSGNTDYRLHFRFENDSEMSFITTNDNTNLEKTNSVFALTETERNASLTNVLSFTVGFQSDTEGCYCNTMGVFIRNNQTDEDSFLGVIRFLTEVEDEDERYRTLFTNFGIPDPIKFPNVFKEQDVDEESVDWRIVNKKSKELFLCYDEIFPYVGTYKALFNAIKYLGYQDIIFKEWYKIKDKNDNSKFVAIQNYDTSTGLSIESSLKKYGVDYGEYDRYTKLNRLSMVYHMQQIDENLSESNLSKTTTDNYAYYFQIGSKTAVLPNTTAIANMYGIIDNTTAVDEGWKDVKVKCVSNSENGKYYLKIVSGKFLNRTTGEYEEINSGYIKNNVKLNVNYKDFVTSTITDALVGERYTISIKNETNRKYYDTSTGAKKHTVYNSYNNTDIEDVINVYEYRTDEILAKLYSVKHWLETYITGVNCYISDINGEGLVLERLKTVGYVTMHEFKDISNEGKFTPHCSQKTDFNDSSAIITCSLNEFDCVSFADYSDYPIERFIKGMNSVTVNGKTETIYDSAPLKALTVADEYQYVLNLDDAESGSLYEFTANDSSTNPIVISDGEIKFWDQTKIFSNIDSKELPVIQINKGNLRIPYNNWSADYLENSNVMYSIYQTTNADGFSYTIMKNLSTGKYIRCKGNVTLSPSRTNLKFYYSSDNAWQMPMFFISGYKVSNQYKQDLIDSDITGDNSIPSASDFFTNETQEYILEIIEGDIKFRNHRNTVTKQCKSADVFFAQTFREEETGEQVIGVNYTYESDRVPLYKLDLSKINPSYTDYKSLYNSLDNAVTCNTDVDIPVNRLGKYKVSVKAYDSYNNIFSNKSDDICEVKSKMPSIDIVVNSEYSNNDNDFYRYNKEADAMSYVDVSTLLHSVDSSAIFPINYKIYSAEHIVDDQTITYDNITYALDTPKANDYMLLTNLTEQAYSITGSSIVGNNVTINMKSNNPGKQNIFISGGKVNICVYDDNTHTILFKTDTPCPIVGKPVLPTVSGNQQKNGINGSIVITMTKDMPQDLATLVNNHTNNINLYVINATEVDIPLATEIENNVAERYAFIPLYNNHTDSSHIDDIIDANEENYSVDTMLRHFPKDTMIKLSMFVKDSNGTTVTLSETAYRLLDTSIRTYEDGENSTVKCGYVIDGNIDLNYINNLHNVNVYNYTSDSSGTYRFDSKDVSVVIKPMNTNPVQYSLRVDKDALESTTIFGDYDYYAMNTTVKYNSQQLLFDSYFDDSYAASILTFDPMSLVEIWDGSYENYIDSSLYMYTDFPVTIQQNRKVIVKPSKNNTQLESGFKNRWKWKIMTIEDNSNWPNRQSKMEKILLFESINDILSVKPYMLGSQSVELYCTDKYGNVIKNTGGGNIYVKEFALM